MDIIIVHDKNKITKKVADVFQAMISEFDDINSVLWEEKQYIDTNPDVSSEQYIIFLGHTKTAQNLISSPTFHTEWVKFNMKYGWIGKRAILFVDEDYKFNDNILSEFATLYNETFNKELQIETKHEKIDTKKTLKDKIKELPLPAKIAAGAGFTLSAILTGGAAPIFTVVAGFATTGIGAISTATVGSYYIGNKIYKNKLNKDKIITNSYQVLIKHFLTNGIKTFLKIEE